MLQHLNRELGHRTAEIGPHTGSFSPLHASKIRCVGDYTGGLQKSKIEGEHRVAKESVNPLKKDVYSADADLSRVHEKS